ncbi:hypothetical protein FA13DRAFT_1734420 [Coprinellus micaceus]|uniref:DUF5648 domain-containing protein n=1 Tax=Coprinellus micaceus TaxID=71717 RepID=A0A4Y7T6P6_COPMI|nr:hypothetical protein FA13DRAFT_1734420 [Coprinellus micaceus]
MQLKLSTVFLALVSAAVAAPSASVNVTDKVDGLKERAALACGNPAHATPLYRSFSGGSQDHFYTANLVEHTNAFLNLGYTNEGIAGLIFPSQEEQTVPLFRLYQGGIADHFYTTSVSEKNNARDNLGYTDEGIAGFVYTDTACGGQAFYRLWNSGWNDHFYTMSFEERENAAVNLGFAREGVVGYIFPA